MAQFMWARKYAVTMSDDIRDCVQALLDGFLDPAIEWHAKIPFVIPREANAISIGDASLLGGGAHCQNMEFWFTVTWSQ
jgi:hypothetical protein